MSRLQTNFTSYESASSATGIPIAVLKDAKRKGCPAMAHSRINLPEFIRWYFDPDREKARKKGEIELFDLNQERARLARADAEKRERDNRLEEREVVQMSEARAVILAALQPIRQMLDGLPSEMGPKVNPENPAFAMSQMQAWVDNQLPGIRYAVQNVEKK